jgi:hypothetical protein
LKEKRQQVVEWQQAHRREWLKKNKGPRTNMQTYRCCEVIKVMGQARCVDNLRSLIQIKGLSAKESAPSASCILLSPSSYASKLFNALPPIHLRNIFDLRSSAALFTKHGFYKYLKLVIRITDL